MTCDNIAILIDGYNFYHAIKAHIKNVQYPKCLKWLDYDSVARNIILKNKSFDKLKIRFYTAKNTYKYDKNGKPHDSNLHYDIYKQALESKNIEVIEGKFKFRDEPFNTYAKCKNCQHEHFIHKFDIVFPQAVTCSKCGSLILPQDVNCLKKVEEKKTDVKIAIDLVNIARDGEYNKIFLFSTDSDYIPAAEYIKKNCQNVQLVVVAPSDKITHQTFNSETNKIETISQYRFNVSEFNNLGILIYRIRLSKFTNCLFPDTITLPNGKTLINPWL